MNARIRAAQAGGGFGFTPIPADTADTNRGCLHAGTACSKREFLCDSEQADTHG